MIRQHRCGTWAAATGLWVGLCVASVAAAGVQYNAVILAGGPGWSNTARAYGVGDGIQVGSIWEWESRATAWKGTAQSTSYADSSYWKTIMRGTGGGQIVGYKEDLSGYSARALLWPGFGETPIDLTPPGYQVARAYGVSGGQQVGYGGADYSRMRALLWTGTADSVVDLTPADTSRAAAYGIAGGQQVGMALYGGQFHAYLWHGSNVGVDLHPAGYTSSVARGTSGARQAGHGTGPEGIHALAWTGTAESVVDLNPDGYDTSWAMGAAGDWQVGYGYKAAFGSPPYQDWNPRTETGLLTHALGWQGSAESVIDLHTFLPSNYFASEAFGVDSSGNIVGVGYTWVIDFEGLHSLPHAVMWTPVPEPMSCGLLLIAAAWSVARGRR